MDHFLWNRSPYEVQFLQVYSIQVLQVTLTGYTLSIIYIYIYIWCSVAHPPPPCGWVMVHPPLWLWGCGGALLVSDAADFLWFLVPPPPCGCVDGSWWWWRCWKYVYKYLCVYEYIYMYMYMMKWICTYNHMYMRVEQKVLNRGLHCEGPGVCNYQSRLKIFPEMAKENFLLAKDLAKVYVYVICI